MRGPGRGALVPAFAALVLVVPALAPLGLLGCEVRPVERNSPSPAKARLPAAGEGGITLPSLDGLGLTKAGPLDESADGAADAKKWLRKVTVDVPAGGDPVVVDVREASQWRGVPFPKDEGQSPIPTPFYSSPDAFRITVEATGAIGINRTTCKDMTDFRSSLVKLKRRRPDYLAILDPQRSAPFEKVMRVMAVMVEEDVIFGASVPYHGRSFTESCPELRKRLRNEGKLATRDRMWLPNVNLRIRADASAACGAVLDVLYAASASYVWRVSFLGILDGREVEFGSVWTSPEEPPWPREPPLRIYQETGIRYRKDHRFGPRSGVSRKRAVLDGGGSRESESAVESALGWLVRNQEEDGRWDAAKHGGREGADAEVTGLALLALLGRGSTEKKGEHRAAVGKAVGWIVRQQADDGCIGQRVENGIGRHHAICGLALAEAFGTALTPRTGLAAQKAVTYSIPAYEAAYGRMRYGDRFRSEVYTTAWYVMQLRSATVAGLTVDGKGPQAAVALMDRAGPRREPSRYKPVRRPDLALWAVDVFTRLMTGSKRTVPILIGGANYLSEHLPRWDAGAPNFDFRYWHFASLAMFQMSGEWWKQWNVAMKAALVERQRKGDPDAAGETDLDGSWDPADEWGNVGGRVYSTAMCAMCIETYYRYHPLYGN